MSVDRQTERARPGAGMQGIAGLLLLAFWWPVAWLGSGWLSRHSFFPLWLGFILALDGLIERRTRTSLLARSRRKFLLLFALSAPFWWYFEWVNRFVDNWHYVQPQPLSTLGFVVSATLPFATVIPAVLEMSELFASFRVGERLPSPGPLRLDRPRLVLVAALGWLSLALTILLPRYFFPFAWTSLFLILEPVNVALGQRSIGWFAAHARWEAIWNVSLATLATGFFWEMWNYYSLPKWYYSIPGVGFWHIFEMPLLGFGGYLPFGLEVFAFYAFGFWLLERRPQDYARVGSDALPWGKEAAPSRPRASWRPAAGSKPRQRRTGSRG